MYFVVYRIDNMINGKYYIGSHKTVDLNDGYMGSGIFLKQAYRKYGRKNFLKTILHIFNNDRDMRMKEEELITLSKMSYNKSPFAGGMGRKAGLKHSEESIKKMKHNRRGIVAWNKGLGIEDERVRVCVDKMRHDGMLGKKHSEESIQKMRKPRENTENYKGAKSNEHALNISKALKGIKHPVVTCEACNKTMNVGNFHRWHKNCGSA